MPLRCSVFWPSPLAVVARPLRSWLARALIAFLLVGALPAADVDSPAAEWRLDNVSKIGGFAPNVLGSPQISPEAGEPVLVFDGKDDGLVLPQNPLAGLRAFTVEILLRPDADGQVEQRFFHTQDRDGHRALLELRLDPQRSSWALDTFLFASATHKRTLIEREKTHAAGEWHWVALVYDGKTMAHYVDGVREASGEVAFPPMSDGETSVGARLNRAYWFKGAMRVIRVTPRALSDEELMRAAQPQRADTREK